jgi:hypothetical protein
MEILMPVFGVLAVIAFVSLMLWWHYSRSASLLDQWADQNGYRLVSREYRHLFKGPYFWTSSRGQTVYRIVAEDGHGHQRSGWARCGGWFFGLLSDNVEVRWD